MINRIWPRRVTQDADGVLEALAVDVAPSPRLPRLPAFRLPALPKLPRSFAEFRAIDVTPVLRAMPILAVLLAALAVNLPTIHDYFHGDDFVAFTELGSKKPLQYLSDTFTFKDVNFYWRPLGQASYLALYQAFGLDPVAFHGLSIAMFLATVWLLYRFCLNAGFSRFVAVGAAAMFALMPSHVVSVAWVTNSPRVMAVMFFMASMVVLQKGLARRSPWLEVAAWLLFLLCPLADETSMALAPVPVMYSAIHTGRLKVDWAVAARAFFYAAVVVSLAPLQFMFTLDDEPRLADYAVGPHILNQTWALTSQLVLPLAEGSPLALSFQALEPAQWAAGALAIAGGGVLLLVGSWKMRVLALWTALALAPFTLWDIEWMSPRYVYMAAVPYSILFAWLVGTVIDALRQWRRVQFAAFGVAVAIGLVAVVPSVEATLERNEDWANSTEPFRILAQGVPAAVPEAPKGTRFVIYYGIWQDFPLWPRVVVRTIYKDESIDVISVDRRNVDSYLPRREPRDIVVYYSNGHFLPIAPTAARE